VNALVAGSLLAFGGAYLGPALIASAAAAGLALLCRPGILAEPDTRRLDLAFVAIAAYGAVQLVPVPAALLGWLSPGSAAFARATLIQPDPQALSARPISIDPDGTAYALALATAVALVFWTCRDLFARGGAGPFVRGVAITGALAALLAIAQRATSPYHLYWRWQPEVVNAQPFGPFVNRNFFATWMVMAIPLSLGYLIARLPPRSDRHVDRLARIARALDTRSIWTLGACCLMASSVMLSRSRSGVLGLAAAVATLALMGRGRVGRRHAGWLAGYGLLIGIALAVWSNLDGMVGRFAESFQDQGQAGRWTIWQESIPALREYWLTGSGAGSYETVMRVHQRSFRTTFYFNQAHNHYLQIAVEGGLVHITLAACAMVPFLRLARRRLEHEEPARYWIRAGALAGLAGVAVQSVWETGLRMPANAFLCATLAALSIHRSGRARTGAPLP
jgi:O-antigen ligase